MEITRSEQDGCLELGVKGRLDGYWAQHLGTALDDVMREGIHHLRLNLAHTTYISSAGIRVLVEAYKQFAAVAGSLVVVEPSASVRQVLTMAGLGQLMTAAAAPAAAPASEAPPERWEAAGCACETYELQPGAALRCRVMGQPERLAAADFAALECEQLSLAPDIFALGVGAFQSEAPSRDRLGEFLAVAGAGACQPTDGTNCADYMVGSGGFVPRMAALYGVACRGRFARLMRFESHAARGPAALSAIVEACLEASGSQTVGMVMVAESAGLLGAALKRSPAAANGGSQVFAHPEVRQWLSFSPERSHARSVALVAGVAARAPGAVLAPVLRPMGGAGGLAGHFHAAAFGYHPLQKGRIAMLAAVTRLFETGGLKSVLHLLADDRTGSGAGESEFLRGACWISPLDPVLSPEETL